LDYPYYGIIEAFFCTFVKRNLYVNVRNGIRQQSRKVLKNAPKYSRIKVNLSLYNHMKASDLFVKALENEGVEYIFGVPGEENLDILECGIARGGSQIF